MAIWSFISIINNLIPMFSNNEKSASQNCWLRLLFADPFPVVHAFSQFDIIFLEAYLLVLKLMK